MILVRDILTIYRILVKFKKYTYAPARPPPHVHARTSPPQLAPGVSIPPRFLAICS